VLIDVVTVVLNDEQGLFRTWHSLESQSFINWRWIVRDGGSRGKTVDFLKSLGSRVHWVSEPDGGIYDAMNRGVGMCKGDYVIFMNAGDTFFHTNNLAMVAAMVVKVEPSVPDILFGGAMFHFPNGREVYRPPKRVESYLWHGLPANHQATLYRRAFLGENPYDLQYSLCGDYYLAAKLCRKGAAVAYLDMPIARFAIGGTSYNKRRQLFVEAYRIQRDVLGVPLLQRIVSACKRLAAMAGLFVLSQPILQKPKL